MEVSAIFRTMNACSSFRSKVKSLPQKLKTKCQTSKVKAKTTLAKAKADLKWCQEEVDKLPPCDGDGLSPQKRLSKDTACHITYHSILKPTGERVYKRAVCPIFRYALHQPAVTVFKKVIRPTAHVLGSAYRFTDYHCTRGAAMYNNKFGKEYGYGDCIFVPPPPEGIPTDYETYVPASPEKMHTSNMLRDTEFFLGMPSAPRKGPNKTSASIMVPTIGDGRPARPIYEIGGPFHVDNTDNSSIDIEACPSLDSGTSSISSSEDTQVRVVLTSPATVAPGPGQTASTETWVLESPFSEPLGVQPNL